MELRNTSAATTGLSLSRGLWEWLSENDIKTLYIEEGCTWQNGYIESFNARLREKCLNRKELWTLKEARVVIEDWRWRYNHVRPHRSLGYMTPNEFAQDDVEEEVPGQRRALGLGYCLPASQHWVTLRHWANNDPVQTNENFGPVWVTRSGWIGFLYLRTPQQPSLLDISLWRSG